MNYFFLDFNCFTTRGLRDRPLVERAVRPNPNPAFSIIHASPRREPSLDIFLTFPHSAFRSLTDAPRHYCALTALPRPVPRRRKTFPSYYDPRRPGRRDPTCRRGARARARALYAPAQSDVRFVTYAVTTSSAEVLAAAVYTRARYLFAYRVSLCPRSGGRRVNCRLV